MPDVSVRDCMSMIKPKRESNIISKVTTINDEEVRREML